MQCARVADFLFVDQPDALAQLCFDLAEADWLAVDTEFLRERTYYPQLCLIQIAAPHRIACIDPLALADLAPLAQLLAEPRIVKVLHAARQDIEVLYQRLGVVPRPLFDTQLAAALTGFGEQVGYAALVESFISVRLPKAHTRTDWSRRPLPAAALTYAADDVRYLGTIYERLRHELATGARRAWLDAEAAALADPAVYLPDPDASYLRVRGQSRLAGAAERGALRALAAWRERRAISRNRPRQWIASDAVLLELATRRPASMDELTAIEGAAGLLKGGCGEELLAVIASGNTASLPVPPERPRPERALVDRLAAVLRRRAAELHIGAGLLANRRQLERLAQGERNVPVLEGWRREAVGDALLAVLIETAASATE